MSDVLERFLRYVQIDTQSQEDEESIPSTAKQFDLSRLLAKELEQLGATDVKIDDHAYVYATIPATTDKTDYVLGFIAHVDTAPVVSGKDVKPTVIKNYDGKDIRLGGGAVIKTDDYPCLKKYIGQDIVTSDGTTLLGADDKAGVAEIMAMAKYLTEHKEVKHGTIKIAFTPDEEVGRGADMFDVEGFGADFAFTVDGGEIGEIEYQNFNAASAKVEVNGLSIHPGDAKGKMVNAAEIVCELQSMLPATQKPQYTEGYEGFFHLAEISGDVSVAKCFYIIRDHDMAEFENKKTVMRNVCLNLNKKYGDGTVKLTLKDGYYNMEEKILPHLDKIELVKKAFEKNDVKPLVVPIRGGTDGARLSFLGLPCPNLCTGGANYHSPLEFIPVQSMEKITQTLVTIAQMFAEKY